MRKSYYNPTTLHDLLMNTLLGFILLFTVAFLLIKPMDELAKPKAEFIVTVTWDENRTSDVDTWLQDPAGNIAHFRQKDVGLMHLDRDDLGTINDTITLPDGQRITIPVNQEITSIRGFIPGEWVLNVHLYNDRGEGPIAVTIRIDKLNPSVRTVFRKTVKLKHKWDEITVTRFTMASDGNILEWTDLPKKLIETSGLSSVNAPSLSNVNEGDSPGP